VNRRVLALVIVPVLAVLAAVVAIGTAPETSAAWLDDALTRMETTTARLEMNAVAEMRGSAALGGGFAQTTRATGELVPPDRLHLLLDGSGLLELVMIGHRLWVDDGNGLRVASGIRLGPLAEAQAPFTFIRGPGIAQFAGVGVSRGMPTYRIRLELDAFELQARMVNEEIDPDTVGVLEIEVGLFDGLIRRQSVEVVEPTDPFSGTSLTTVRTAYTIEYWDHGRPLEVAEPR
jgi:flavin-binding protein dodecin